MSGLEESERSSADTSSGEKAGVSAEPNDADTVYSCDSSSEPFDADTVFSCDSPNDQRFHNFDSTTRKSLALPVKIPIVGYEVMEERAKFTVFKLRIEAGETDDFWFVFRRYTDFVRLHSKLKVEHPEIKLFLPKKKWFNNYDPNFLDERIEGLQELINSIVQHKELVGDPTVRDFFCLDEPPSAADNLEESKAVVEALEERVYHLQRQLKEKETAYERLKAAHSVEIAAKLRLAGFVQECTRQCPSCAARLSALGQVAQ